MTNWKNPCKYKRKETIYAHEIEEDYSTDKIYYKKIYSYLSFLSKVNFSNNLLIKNINLC